MEIIGAQGALPLEPRPSWFVASVTGIEMPLAGAAEDDYRNIAYISAWLALERWQSA